MAGKSYSLRVLRALGKNLEAIQTKLGDESKALIGKCYLASCNLVDNTQANITRDKELVRIFADNIESLAQNSSFSEDLDEEAFQFVRRVVPDTIPPVSYGLKKALYDISLSECRDNSYYETGNRILLASEALRKELPQDNKQFVQDHAVMILSRYIDRH